MKVELERGDIITLLQMINQVNFPGSQVEKVSELKKRLKDTLDQEDKDNGES